MSGFEGFLIGIFVGWLIWGQWQVGRWRMVWGVALGILFLFGGLYAIALLLEPEDRRVSTSVPGVMVWP